MSGLRSALGLRAKLGEGPVWHRDERALYWVDVFKPSVNRFDPATGENRAIAAPEPVHAVALTGGMSLIAVLDASLAYCDFASGRYEPIVTLIDGVATNLNDGRCDRAGRFWVGAKARDWESPLGALFRLDRDGSIHRMEEGIKLSNGLGWSPDNRAMYYIDSAPGEIYAYDFDFPTGAIANRRVLVRVPKEAGLPDGMTVDAAGFLWVAQWGGARVVRYDPDGKIERTIAVPASRPTSCMFGGNDLTTLFITSGTMRMSAAELAAEPQAGNLFALETDIEGLPEPHFAGG